MSASSTPAAPGGLNKRLLYGIGAGCGCLSLIVGVVAIVLVFGSLSRTPPGPPEPQPQPQPLPQPPQPQPQPLPQPPQPQPQPQPVPPQPQPGGTLEGPDDFKIAGAQTVRVQGQPPNIAAGEPTSTFTRGETVGFQGVFAVVRGSHDALILWVRMEGERPVVVAKGEPKVSEADQGKTFLFTVSGTQQAPPGVYRVGIIKVVGQQGQPVTIRQFQLQ